jgi:hypothetical protein
LPPSSSTAIEGAWDAPSGREHRGEPILVSWYDHDEGPAVRDVIRLV